jgi:hypothetical protein
MKQSILITILVIISNTLVQAQIAEPKFWQKSEDIGKDAAKTANFKSIKQSRSINYNPILQIGEGESLIIDNIETSSEKVTVMLVYQVNDSLREQNVWQIGNGSTTGRAGQTTQQIIDNYGVTRFRENNSTLAVVSTQTQKIEKTEDETYTLTIGTFDTLPFNGKIGEVLVFSDVLHNNVTKTWESYLAIKYGVTLYERNYYNSREDSVWNYFKNEPLSEQIIGIGRDDYFDLYQKQSITPTEKIIFGTEDNHKIDNLQHIMLGIDTTEFKEKSKIYLENGVTLTKYGQFRIQKTGTQDIPTFLEIDCSDLDISTKHFENLYLLINRSGENNFYGKNIDFYPATVADTINKTLTFKNIHWDRDNNGSDIFCLALLTPDSTINDIIIHDINPNEEALTYLENIIENNNTTKPPSSQEQRQGQTLNVTVYPTPSTGTFTLDLQLPEKSDITINIINYESKIVQTRKLTGQNNYNEQFTIPTKGEYTIKIQTRTEEKTAKVVIN